MNILVIEANNEDNMKLLIELAKKLGSKVSTIDKDDIEDIGLMRLMRKVKTGEKVEKNTILQKLKS